MWTNWDMMRPIGGIRSIFSPGRSFVRDSLTNMHFTRPVQLIGASLAVLLSCSSAAEEPVMHSLRKVFRR
jgi:hypothetical protein